MPPVRNIRPVSGKKFAVEAANIKALQARFTDIARAADGDKTQLTNASAAIGAAFTSVAKLIRDKARTNLSSSRYPNVMRRLGAAIFAFTDPNRPSDRNKRSSLVGVRTGASPRKESNDFGKNKGHYIFVEWGKGHRRRKDNTVAVNGLGVSLAHIFNRGTKNRKIRPTRFFHNALYQTKAAAVRMIHSAYDRAVKSINATP